MSKTVIGSVGRIADLETVPYDIEAIDLSRWDNGDYVAGTVTGEANRLYQVEATDGEMIPIDAGDIVIGAFGRRAATLEGVGSWSDIRDGHMHCMTSAALIGAFTSMSTFLPEPVTLEYAGHILRGGEKLTMADFAIQSDHADFAVPTILLVGTSMSAGKTSTGKLVIEELTGLGYEVVGTKLTGAGRYRDVLGFRAAGAAEIFDFVDAGLPSTVVGEDEFRAAIRPLLRTIDALDADFLVAEAGASPLEPYNGAAAIDELGDNICCTILCASDPYAVLGVERAFGLKPDLVSGPATTTSAGRDLVLKLTGVAAYNILDPTSLPRFKAALVEKLGLTKA